MSFVQSTKKRANLDEEFTIKIPNGFEYTLDIFGEFDPDHLKICLSSSTSYPDPQIKIIDQGEGFYRVKLFLKGYPLTSAFRFVAYEASNNKVVDVVEHEIISKFPRIAKARKLIEKVAVGIFITLVFALVLFVDEEYNNSKIDKYYSMFTAKSIKNWFKSTSSKLDIRVMTNKHEFYKSLEFLEVEQDLREEFGEEGFSFKKEMWFVGEVEDKELFTMRELFRLTGQTEPKISTRVKAAEFCDEIKGHIPTTKELDQALFGKASKIPDFAWKVKTESHYPEWTSDHIEDEYYAIFMKKEMLPPINAKNIHGKIAGDEEETYAAFRCVFTPSNFE